MQILLSIKYFTPWYVCSAHEPQERGSPWWTHCTLCRFDSGKDPQSNTILWAAATPVIWNCSLKKICISHYYNCPLKRKGAVPTICWSSMHIMRTYIWSSITFRPLPSGCTIQAFPHQCPLEISLGSVWVWSKFMFSWTQKEAISTGSNNCCRGIPYITYPLL